MMKLEKFKEEKKKKKSILVFTICCVLLIVGVFFYQSFALFETRENFNFIEGQVQDPGDLYFAYYVDDQITYDMPSKDSGYTLSSKSSCTNGVTISWDEERWGAFVDYANYKKENNSRVKCTLYFEEKVIPSFSDVNKDYIIAKADETMLIEDDGTIDHNLRYIGADPNNYLDIGEKDEDGNVILWRIIGVMNNIKSSEDDILGETNLKIIRNKSIAFSQFDRIGTSWTGSIVLAKVNEYLDNIGENVSNNFLQVLWNLTGLSSPPSDIIDLYDYEHAYKNANYVDHKTWIGKLGLLCLSDYGFATSGGLTTDRGACLSNSLNDWHNFNDCFNSDWLYSSESAQGYWTMTYKSTESSYVFGVTQTGRTYAYYSNISRDVFPVGYLSLNAKMVGEGSVDSPFVLSKE